ncbi:MAG TPA: toxin-antitoxin system HicB family antitoxin [Polyangia bacterium]|nr:toxin-antitoxin system HicB family antitoxin [Polyangia bacterium]
MLEVMLEDGRSLPPEDASADYSGQLRLRLPKSLHECVSQLATAEGVSLNTLLLSLIAEGCGRQAPAAVEPAPKAARKRKAAA